LYCFSRRAKRESRGGIGGLKGEGGGGVEGKLKDINRGGLEFRDRRELREEKERSGGGG